MNHSPRLFSAQSCDPIPNGRDTKIHLRDPSETPGLLPSLEVHDQPGRPCLTKPGWVLWIFRSFHLAMLQSEQQIEMVVDGREDLGEAEIRSRDISDDHKPSINLFFFHKSIHELCTMIIYDKCDTDQFLASLQVRNYSSTIANVSERVRRRHASQAPRAPPPQPPGIRTSWSSISITNALSALDEPRRRHSDFGSEKYAHWDTVQPDFQRFSTMGTIWEPFNRRFWVCGPMLLHDLGERWHRMVYHGLWMLNLLNLLN